MLYGFARGKLFERFDGLLRVGHRDELVLDAVCCDSECVVLQKHANSVSSRIGGQAIRHELNRGACCNGAVGVVEMVGTLGHDEERQSECECAKRRAGATVRYDSGAVGEQ